MTEQLTIDAAPVLDAAAERIRPAGAWTTQTSARNQRGRVCDMLDADACSWCATGAIFVELHAVLPDRLPHYDRAQAAGRAYQHLSVQLDRAGLPTTESIIKANDELGFTQGQMVGLLADMAATCRKQGVTLTLTVA